MIQEIQKHANNDNIFYIEELADIIIEEKISTIEQLKEFEKKYNELNCKFKNIEEIVNFWINVVDNDPYEYDDVSYDKLQELKKERKLMDDSILENKILHIIKYYFLTDRNNPFPYYTYQFILQGKL
jgi:hypothetical protein